MNEWTRQSIERGVGRDFDNRNQFSVGDTLQGFGLTNAGRFATVKAIGKGGRIQIERHLDGKVFWTFPTYWRLAD